MLGKIAAFVAAAIGALAATGGSQASIGWIWDEPEMPKSLIEK